MSTHKIRQIAVADLVPYARNAKKHDDAQVAKIAGAIREFGFGAPIITDGENGILAGHGRWLAAQKLGLETVPCVEMGHLTETQRKAYILTDNRLGEIGGGWDMDLLRLELEELGNMDVDLDALGFGEDMTKAFDVDEVDAPALADGDRQPFRQMTFTVHDEQHEEIEAALAKAKKDGGGESAVNENSNGNALAWICGRFNRG